ncbi:MAG: FAD-dependent oxidoreductase [Oscillospiraceae bacterium]|nr:FAD-dependent oxidoreductase [Oscillospiraceae bacterium]
MYDLIIVGGGPAGLTAATYARRAGKSVLVIEKNAFGGQITWSPKVENFPGFTSVSGTELGDRLLEQAMNLGAEVELDEVTALEMDAPVKRVFCGEAFYEGRAVILATGARPRPLGVARETELVGSGVCYCAVCDGAFYAGRPVAVCGGGNSALQDAMLLSESCSSVTLIHRRSEFRGEQMLVEALRRRPNVRFLTETVVEELVGENELRAVVVRKGGERLTLEVEGLFVAVGHQPDHAAFAPWLELDRRGYADAGEDCLTPTPGLFVAGDCRSKAVRQLTTAAADGAVAALAACAFVDANT